MSVFNLFSKRQKSARGKVQDVYIYDALPERLRVQIVQIIASALGAPSRNPEDPVYSFYQRIVKAICRELGVFELGSYERHPFEDRDFQTELFNFILHHDEVEQVIDAIELSFKEINDLAVSWPTIAGSAAGNHFREAIDEVNIRFQEAGVGYRFEAGKIIRIDSEFVHAEIVKPALELLRNQDYKGAEEEFLKAHDHYRRGRVKECLTECLKALESTMKTIAANRKWKVDPKATAKPLIDLMLTKNLIPSFWAQEWGGLRSILENGVPTARNKLSGHGQGAQPVSVPDHIAAFVLHQTAAAIVFLISAEMAHP